MGYTYRCPECGHTANVAASVRIVVCFCGSNRPRGLGDQLERLLNHVGGRQFKRAYRWLFRRDCGCDGRRRWLNALFDRRNRQP